MDEMNKEKFVQAVEKIKEQCNIPAVPLFSKPDNWSPGEAAIVLLNGLAAVEEEPPEPDEIEIYDDGTVMFEYTPKETGVEVRTFCRPEGTLDVRSIMTYSEAMNLDGHSGYDFL